MSAYTGSYGGKLCGPGHETPSVHEIAVAIGRICRWAGNGVAFYTVLQHSMAVADLLPDSLKFYGLVHDATEATMGDAPRPFKAPVFKEQEAVLAWELCDSFGVPHLSEEKEHIVKSADDAMLSAEVWAGIGPWRLVDHFPDRDTWAEGIAREYLHRYKPEDCINPGGLAVSDFIHLFHHYRSLI